MGVWGFGFTSRRRLEKGAGHLELASEPLGQFKAPLNELLCRPGSPTVRSAVFLAEQAQSRNGKQTRGLLL